MNDNSEKAQADIERQRLINRAALLTASILDEKGFCFGKIRIGSVLKGHKHYNIPEIVGILINESCSYKGIISTENKCRVMRAYFGRFNTLEDVGKSLGVIRERIRQIIQKEITRFNRFPKVQDELTQINALIRENPRTDVKAVLKLVYGRDDYSSDELRVFEKLVNYMLKSKGYCTFRAE